MNLFLNYHTNHELEMLRKQQLEVKGFSLKTVSSCVTQHTWTQPLIIKHNLSMSNHWSSACYLQNFPSIKNACHWFQDIRMHKDSVNICQTERSNTRSQLKLCSQDKLLLLQNSLAKGKGWRYSHTYKINRVTNLRRERGTLFGWFQNYKQPLFSFSTNIKSKVVFSVVKI